MPHLAGVPHWPRAVPLPSAANRIARPPASIDNAQQESFWATLKVEFYDRYLWPTKAAAKVAVGDWIERVYNRRRRHSAIAIMSPVDFEDRLTQTAQAARPCLHQTGSSSPGVHRVLFWDSLA
ncbi:integrase core domain-containing protein [Mycobacterium sp.]|uniref:integrase core domain-containing protein n=1 Tax=Mycobacterium sp. TaxID=1785 RepID=UPI003C761871